MNNNWGLSKFDLTGDKTSVNVSKIHRKNIKRESFEDHLDNLMTDNQHIENSKITWHGKGAIFQVGSHYIDCGFVYVGNHMIGFDGSGTECALINPNLHVKFGDPYYRDSTLGYWPHYSKLSGTCRGAYLQWLASGKEDPGVNIGYVFLYFYGLERRILLDHKNGLVSDEEFKDIYIEVKRLKGIYGTNRSFNNYSSDFLEYMLMIRPDLATHEMKLNDELNFEFNLYLAKFMSSKKPLPALIAEKLAYMLGTTNSRSTLYKCKDEASVMFRYYYKQEFNEGVALSQSEEMLAVEYKPASGSLSGIPLEKSKVPSIHACKEAEQLVEILEKIEKELIPFSRFINKLENSRDPNIKHTLNAFVLLPKSYLALSENQTIISFKKWLSDSVDAQSGNVSLSHVWLKLNMFITSKVTKKELTLLTNLFEKTGYGFAPDHRYNPEKLAFDSNIYVFETEYEGDFEPSSNFFRIQALIKIGAVLFAKEQKLQFSKLIIDIIMDSSLKEIETLHLSSYLKWVLGSLLEFKGLKPFLKNLDDEDRRMLSLSLTRIYSAIGNACNNKMKELEKAYTLLSVDRTLLITDLHNVSSSSFVHAKKKSAFEINLEHLERIDAETNDVKSILSDIFTDENIDDFEKEEKSQDNKVDIKANSDEFNGLSGNNLVLFNKLKTKEEWELDDIESLCKELGLMMEGSIEEINDWAFDLVDAAIIELDDMVYVDLEIIEEIESM